MTSDDLTPAQLADLAAQCARHRDYLARLRDRMHALKFPITDPLYAAVADAWAATSNLTVVAASKANRKQQPAAEPRHRTARLGPRGARDRYLPIVHTHPAPVQ